MGCGGPFCPSLNTCQGATIPRYRHAGRVWRHAERACTEVAETLSSQTPHRIRCVGGEVWGSVAGAPTCPRMLFWMHMCPVDVLRVVKVLKHINSIIVTHCDSWTLLQNEPPSFICHHAVSNLVQHKLPSCLTHHTHQVPSLWPERRGRHRSACQRNW